MESEIEQRMRWAPRGSGAGRSASLASHGHPRHRYAANLPARRASFPASATDALGRVNLSAAALPLLAGGLEFMLVAAAAFEAGAAYHMIVFGSLPYATAYFVATLFLAGLYVVRSGLARVYSIKWLQDPKEQLRRVFRHWNVAFSIFVLALFLTHATDFYSRGAIIAQYAVGLAACVVVRLLLTRAATRALDSGRLKGKKVVVIGEAGLVHRSVRRLYAESRGVDIVSVITLTSNGSDAGTDDKALAEETEAALQAIQNVARRAPLDDVVISLPWSDDARIRAILEGLAAVPAAAHLAPDQLWASAGNPIPARVGRMQTIRLARAPMSLKDRILKRASDIVMASLLLVLASPVLALIALAIKLDSPGPVVFRQRRNGFNQQEFRVLKFRTMRTLDDGTVIQQATAERPARHPRRPHPARAPISTSCRSSSTCSRATCRWSGRARMRSPTTTNTRRRSGSMRAATTSSRASPAGRR